eukprot:TRINITY_DN4958_c0_g1_i2.p1 TRINITY_DN4958_c0_g1~~TRINITY_DN4958_c0_g1_i2.p1  ORF type:complete len:499 (+),score=45.89 TRINITY_DN4958_c0_g1_i2:63-1559(+)
MDSKDEARTKANASQKEEKTVDPEYEKEMFAKFCKAKAVNSTHPLLNWIFGFLTVLFSVTAFICMKLEVLPLPEQTPRIPKIIQRAVPGFFLSVGIEWLVVILKRKDWYRINDAVNSITMGAFEQAFSQIFLSSFKVFPYLWVHHNFALITWGPEPVSWSAWWAMFVCVELGYYWLHRFHHEWNVLWAGHNVHHSSEEYNLTTALRQSPLQTLFSWIFYVPFALFFPFELYAFHNQLNTLYQFWIHTRVIGRLPWPLEFILNTPSHHRVHHGQNKKCIDKNYGGTLIIFDRLFGTFVDESEIGEIVYGINHMPKNWDLMCTQFHHWKEIWEVKTLVPQLWLKLRVFLDLGPYYNWYIQNWSTRFSPSVIQKPKYVPVTVENYVKYDFDTCNTQIRLYGLLHVLIVPILPLLANGVQGASFFYVVRLTVIFHLWILTRFWAPTPFMKVIEGIRLFSLQCILYTIFGDMIYSMLFNTISFLWVLIFYKPHVSANVEKKSV